MRDYVVETAARFDHTLIQNEDLERHVQQYKSDILSGNKVVLVAHSQGNFFATLARQQLSETERNSM